MNTLLNLVIIVGLTLVSGLADARGFVHAAKIWSNDSVVWPELLKSAAGFGVGIALYWLAIRYLGRVGVVSAEAQTLGWFVVTIVVVALLSGHFLQWHLVDQVISVLLLIGVSWLLYHTAR